jgi:hypothetical protein
MRVFASSSSLIFRWYYTASHYINTITPADISPSMPPYAMPSCSDVIHAVDIIIRQQAVITAPSRTQYATPLIRRDYAIIFEPRRYYFSFISSSFVIRILPPLMAGVSCLSAYCWIRHWFLFAPPVARISSGHSSSEISFALLPDNTSFYGVTSWPR